MANLRINNRRCPNENALRLVNGQSRPSDLGLFWVHGHTRNEYVRLKELTRKESAWNKFEEIFNMKNVSSKYFPHNIF
jgi:hypothetical protein